MKQAQLDLKTFLDERQWNTPGVTKDLFLNIVEETGEIWNVIKWVDVPTQEKLIKEHKDKFQDFIGDQLFLILRIAKIAGVDAEIAFNETLDEYKKRFPINEVKGRHANLYAGGVDHKYDNDK